MARRRDEVQECMDTIVAEARITLDPGLFCKNSIVLSFEVANDLTKRRLVVDLVAEAGCVNDGQRNSGALLVNFELCSLSAGSEETTRCPALTDCDWFDSDALLEMGTICIVRIFGL